MRTWLALIGIWGLCTACASGGLPDRIPAQYPPLPGQISGETIPPSGTSRVVDEDISRANAGTDAQEMEIERLPAPVLVSQPVRTMAIVLDSVTRAFEGRIGRVLEEKRIAEQILRAKESEVAGVRSRRPARPAGMLTSQAVDIALAAEQRWQQEVLAAEASLAMAAQRVRDLAGNMTILEQERERAYESVRASFGEGLAPPVAVGRDGIIVEQGRPSTAPVRRRP